MYCDRCSVVINNIGEYKFQTFTHGEIDTHIWLYDYDKIKDILHSAKYQGEYCHYKHLGKYLALAIKQQCNFMGFCVVPIPSISSHLKRRGYDHAKHLAIQISKYLQSPIENLLVGLHDQSQVSLKRSGRLINPRYGCRRRTIANNVILLDDTATTRTTLFRAASALKQRGVTNIIGATLAYRR